MPLFINASQIFDQNNKLVDTRQVRLLIETASLIIGSWSIDDIPPNAGLLNLELRHCGIFLDPPATHDVLKKVIELVGIALKEDDDDDVWHIVDLN